MVVGNPSRAPISIEIDTNAATVVAALDGVGGRASGRVASRSAAHHLADLAADARDPGDLRRAIIEAGRRLADEASDRAGLAGMATTVAGMWFNGDEVTYFNVGDSRVYLERNGYLSQCTVDDVNISEADGPLTQCLGAGLLHIEPHLTTAPWASAGLALLCTDGFDRRVGVAALEAALRTANPIEALWQLAEGADDDASVVLVDGRFAQASPVFTTASDVGLTQSLAPTPVPPPEWASLPPPPEAEHVEPESTRRRDADRDAEQPATHGGSKRSTGWPLSKRR